MTKISHTLRIKGNEVKCPICSHDKFRDKKTLMNTVGLSFFGFDWANKEAQNYICEECGHVLWFLKEYVKG